MSFPRCVAAAGALVMLVAGHATADVTAFLGRTSDSATGRVGGIALGASLLVVGAEFEFANAREDRAQGQPGFRTGMGNVFLQTPTAILGLRPYVTTGAGLYRETRGPSQETALGFNTGVGVKISLVGPLRVRIDYRAFRLRGNPIRQTLHRLYAGVNLGF